MDITSHSDTYFTHAITSLSTYSAVARRLAPVLSGQVTDHEVFLVVVYIYLDQNDKVTFDYQRTCLL